MILPANSDSSRSKTRRFHACGTESGPLAPSLLIFLAACFATLSPPPACGMSAMTVEFEASLANAVVSGGDVVVQTMSGFG